METVLQKKQEFEEAASVVEAFEESINKDNQVLHTWLILTVKIDICAMYNIFMIALLS